MNGFVTWLLGGTGVLLIYAAIQDATPQSIILKMTGAADKTDKLSTLGKAAPVAGGGGSVGGVLLETGSTPANPNEGGKGISIMPVYGPDGVMKPNAYGTNPANYINPIASVYA